MNSIPAAVDNCSAGQEIPCFCGTRKFIRVYEHPLLGPLLSQMNAVHIFTLCFSKVSFNIIFPSMPRLHK